MSWFDLPSANNRLNEADIKVFNNEIRSKQIRSSRIFTIITLLFSLVFLVSDAEFLPQHLSHLTWIRVSVVLACVAGVYIIEHIRLRNAYLLLGFALIFYNGIIVYIGILASKSGIDTYQQGTIIIIIYCCTLLQTPLLISSIITTACWVSYLIGIVFFSSADIHVIINNTILFLIASILGLLSVAHRERYLLEYFKSTQKLKAQEKKSKEQALKDALTDLPNRLAIMEKLDQYNHAIPENLMVMMADADNFKLLNDQYGHRQGDTALKLIAGTLHQHIVHKNGFVSRYGGEEFLILVEDMNNELGSQLGNTLVKEVASICHESLPEITISIGGYLTNGKETSINDCIERADQTLLRAKSEGKNQFILNLREYET